MSENGASQEKPVCFVICPIGAADSSIRKRSNQVLKYIVNPVLGDRYNVLRADQLAEPGVITHQIVEYVLNAELAVIDLTGSNPNVMYELALRHATGKAFVQIADVREKLPFDIGTQTTILFDIGDLDSVEECKAGLAKQVEAVTQPGHKMVTPIGHVLDLETLKSGTSKDQMLSTLITTVEGLSAKVDSVRAQSSFGLREWELLANLASRPPLRSEAQQLTRQELRELVKKYQVKKGEKGDD
jgi:hypothetical protein